MRLLNFARLGNGNRPEINPHHQDLAQDSDDKISGFAVSDKYAGDGFGFHGGSRNLLWT